MLGGTPLSNDKSGNVAAWLREEAQRAQYLAQNFSFHDLLNDSVIPIMGNAPGIQIAWNDDNIPGDWNPRSVSH